MSGGPRRMRAAEAGGAGGSTPAQGTTITGLSHIAIAVREADPTVALLEQALGGRRSGEEILDSGALRVVFVRLGPVMVELLEPLSPDHTVARFLESRGPGLHHVSLDVPDLEAALERCRSAGVRLIDETPRPGAHGTQVAFLHPKSLGGVLLELCGPKKG